MSHERQQNEFLDGSRPAGVFDSLICRIREELGLQGGLDKIHIVVCEFGQTTEEAVAVYLSENPEISRGDLVVAVKRFGEPSAAPALVPVEQALAQLRSEEEAQEVLRQADPEDLHVLQDLGWKPEPKEPREPERSQPAKVQKPVQHKEGEGDTPRPHMTDIQCLVADRDPEFVEKYGARICKLRDARKKPGKWQWM